jgi:hypothetical protein
MAPVAPCTCGDITPGEVWPRAMPQGKAIESINRDAGMVLVRCGACGGLILVDVDPRGDATAAQSAPENIRSCFPEWLKKKAASSGMTEEAITHAMAKEYIASKMTFGCDLCLGMKPGDARAQMNLVAESGSGHLYQCRRCGTFRWLRVMEKGSARVAAWDYLTHRAALSFKTFLESESAKRGMPPERLADDILRRSI